MPFVKKHLKEKSWLIKGDHIELTPEFFSKNWMRFKKLTGSRFSSIFEQNDFTSPVKMWCEMVKIYKDDSETMYLDAGNAFEPKLREFAIKKLGYKLKTWNLDNCQGDVFKDVDCVVGGMPDGEPINENGEIDYLNDKRMIEIKTCSFDKFKWSRDINGKKIICRMKETNIPILLEKGGNKSRLLDSDGKIIVPESYKLQLSLYLFLRGQTKGMFVFYPLEPEDYANLDNIKINEDKIQYIEFELDRNNFISKYKTAVEWYKKYIVTGKSPKFTKGDIKWLKEEGIL